MISQTDRASNKRTVPPDRAAGQPDRANARRTPSARRSGEPTAPPTAAASDGRIAAVALAIEELDALIHEDAAAASG